MSSEPKNPEDLHFERGTPKDYLLSEASYIAEERDRAESKEKLKGNKQDRKERKLYANLSFVLICMWLIIVLAIFVAIGQKKLTYSDTVIVALLTTTTANVIVIFNFVMKYLFNTGK
ncbi:hypothetical protein SAMN05216490_0088 [Mucilaginibacter mallensis]|uniref:Uncharacterized protein n=1 Tax=Mucilaginibacter mallensis TaxID=652787 RepID=A0A1H1MIS4_MUCMA|nr:hypothetical protein [Mucilaginibacter mallensis]SDR86557.1 hypothetical protein SAMN05216490_0088 [Mucilaginibacter mallensis]